MQNRVSENLPCLKSLCRLAAEQLVDELQGLAELIDATIGDLSRTQSFALLQHLAGSGRQMGRIGQRLCEISDAKDALQRNGR
jgi:hypothetical protein